MSAAVPFEPEVRFVAGVLALDLLAFVRTDPGSPEVRVRIRRRGTWRWVCDGCGRNLQPACPHVSAVMAELGGPLAGREERR